MISHKPLSAICFLTTLLVPGLAGATVMNGTREYSASAFALGSDELLYVERHVEIWRRGRLAERQVTYEDAEGRLIAEKTVEYGANPAVPSFELTDHRLGLKESARVGPREVTFTSGAIDGDSSSKSVPRPAGAVVDAGFDAFMVENFGEIANGRKLEFEFAVPAARRFFKFELRPEGRVEHEGREALLIKMKPASFLLRLAVDPIELVYDLDGRLLEFRGLANVWSEAGDRYRARIVFDYGSDVVASTGSTVGR